MGNNDTVKYEKLSVTQQFDSGYKLTFLEKFIQKNLKVELNS